MITSVVSMWRNGEVINKAAYLMDPIAIHNPHHFASSFTVAANLFKNCTMMNCISHRHDVESVCEVNKLNDDRNSYNMTRLCEMLADSPGGWFRWRWCWGRDNSWKFLGRCSGWQVFLRWFRWKSDQREVRDTHSPKFELQIFSSRWW